MAYLSDPIRVGDVIGEMVSFIRAEWRTLPVLVAPAVLAGIVYTSGLNLAGLRDKPEQMFMADNAVVSTLLTVSTLVVGHWTAATMLAFTLDRRAGRPTGVGAAWLRGLRLFLPLLAVRILVYGASWLGLAFFFVPGVMLYTIFYIADAAYVEERPGLVASLTRSRELTRGSRWRVFILVLMLFGLLMTISLLLEAVRPYHFAIEIVFGVASNVLLYILSLVLTAMLFRQLRTTREGGAADEIAAIF